MDQRKKERLKSVPVEPSAIMPAILRRPRLAFVLFRDIRVRVAHGGSFAQERSKVATHGPAQERTARVRARGAERNHATYTACVRECMVVC